MTQEELEQQIESAVAGFSSIEGVDEDLANLLVGEGYLSYDDLSVIEPSDLMAMGSLTEEQVDKIVEQADERALVAEKVAAEENRKRKETQAAERAAREAAEKAAKAEAELAAKAEAEAKAVEEAKAAAEAAAGASEPSPTESAPSDSATAGDTSVESPEAATSDVGEKTATD